MALIQAIRRALLHPHLSKKTASMTTQPLPDATPSTAAEPVAAALHASDASTLDAPAQADQSAEAIDPRDAREPRRQRQAGNSRAQRPQGNRDRQQQQPARAKTPARPVNPALERLFELYPRLFGAHFLPLKLGVFQELLARHPDDFKKDDLKLAMGQHARSTRYLESVAAGQARHDLDGNVVEAVAPEHVHHALLEIFRRRQARTPEDLRPRLRVRLMEAIETSGLSREAYADLMRVQDEATNALLDEAVAELGLEAAKRDALVRTFEASGKTVAEFSDMYGLDAAEVTSVVERVAREKAAAAALASHDLPA